MSNFVDFQIAVAPLLTLVRNQLRQSLHFCTGPFELGGLGTYYLDHIEVPTADGFADESFLTDVAGFVRRSKQIEMNKVVHGSPEPFGGDPQLETTDFGVHDPEIVIPLRLHFTSEWMLENGVPPLYSDALVIRLVLSMHAEMIRNAVDEDGNPKPWAPKTTISVSDVDFGALGEQISAADQGKIRSLVTGQSVALPVSLQPIKTLLKNKIDLDVFNVGFSIDVPPKGTGHASRVALRWEVNGPSQSEAAWSDFLNGVLGAPLIDQQGCRISVPAGLLTAFSEQMVGEQLQKQLDKGTADFDEVTSWPHASWFPGVVTTVFKIDVPVPFCLNDVEVTVTSTTTFALDGAMLQTVSEIDHSADFWDTASCGSQTGPKDFGSIAAEIFAGFYDPDVSGQLGNLPGCAWTVANEEITCNYPISLPFGAVAASISQLAPTVEGLQLDGVVAVAETKAPMAVFHEHPTLGLTLPSLCDDFIGRAEIPLASIYPGRICDYTGKTVPVILDTDDPPTKAAKQKKLDDLDRLDPVRQFTPFLSSDGYSLSLFLPIDEIVGGTEPEIIGDAPGEGEVVWPDGWYFSNPYPLRVDIWTTDGCKYIESTNTLPVPPKAKQLTKKEQIEQAASKKLNCQTWAVWQPEQIFKYKWWPDPPWERVIEEGIQEHLWRVLVSDLAPSREIEATLGQTRLATATASARGAVHLDLLLEEGSDDGFALAQEPADGSEAEPGGTLRLQQTLLLPTGAFDLPAAAGSLALSAFSPELAWCVTVAGVLLYRIDRPGAPVLIRRFDDTSVRGVVPLPDARVLAWGDEGLVLHSAAARRPLQTISSEPIIDAAHSRGSLFALGNEYVIVFDEQQREVQRWPRPDGATLLGCTERALALGSERGLTVYDRNDASAARGRGDVPSPVANLDLSGIVGVLPVDGVGRRHEIVVQNHDGSSMVLDLFEPQRPRRAATIRNHRWAQTKRLNSIIARPNSERPQIDLYRVENTVLLNRMQHEESASVRSRA